jgi:hypothetical protein
MDVHDGLGADVTHTMAEPPGHDRAGSSAGDAHGHDGDDGNSGQDSSGGYDDTTGSGDTSDSAPTAGDDGSGAGGTEGSTTMTVEVQGQTRELPAEHDYTDDGRPDAAVETGDGRVIVFSDTENNETGAAGPDGKADEAWIVDKSTGRAVGAAHLDPRTGEWVDGVGPDGPSSVPADPSSGEAGS